MRYILYFFTMALLFASGVLVGNMFLPQRAASLASAVSVPGLDTTNLALQESTREQAQRNLDTLNQALTSCPVVVAEQKDYLLNQIKLRLAIESFELKKLKLELEIAKNQETNRPTAEFTQASIEYKQAKERAEKLANDLFPVVQANSETSSEPEKNTTFTQTAKTETIAGQPEAAEK